MKFLLALLFAVNLSANVSPDYIITNYYDPSVIISFDSWKSEKVSVVMKNEAGEIIFDDLLATKKSNGVRYNLKNLNSGKYTIRLENEIKVVEETVILFDGKIVEKEATELFKPVLKYNNERLSVNFLSFNGDVDVKITQNDNVIFSESNYDAKPYSKMYDLSKIGRGVFTVKVSNGRVSKTQTFVK